MRILILNQILYTADNNTIPVVSSIKDTMIYGMCLGFVNTGHTVTLAASSLPAYYPFHRNYTDS